MNGKREVNVVLLKIKIKVERVKCTENKYNRSNKVNQQPVQKTVVVL